MRIKLFLFAALLISFNNKLYSEDNTNEEKTSFIYNFTPSLSGTYTSNSNPPNERSNLEWLFQMQGEAKYEGEKFNFESDIFLQYGQIHPQKEKPEKTQDDIILNIMPSYKFIENPSLRFFLQVKAESKLAEGVLDTQKTYFLDPLFLTNSLFIGEKKYIIKDEDGGRFSITYGLGYSMQMIIKNKFKLISEEVHTTDPEYIGGLSAMLNIDMNKELYKDITFKFSLKSQAIAKNKIYNDIENFRYSGLILSGLQFGVISINYTNRIIYDNEISKSRSMSQSLTIGFKYNF